MKFQDDAYEGEEDDPGDVDSASEYTLASSDISFYGVSSLDFPNFFTDFQTRVPCFGLYSVRTNLLDYLQFYWRRATFSSLRSNLIGATLERQG